MIICYNIVYPILKNVVRLPYFVVLGVIINYKKTKNNENQDKA